VPGAMPYLFHVVLPELQSVGYCPTAGLFTAAEVGAPHRRQRIFVLSRRSAVGDPHRPGREGDPLWWRPATILSPPGTGSPVGDPDRTRLAERRLSQDRPGDLRDEGPPPWPPGPDQRDQWAAVLARWPTLAPATVEPAVRRMADGTARRVDRLRALGNAVVPHVAAHALTVLSTRLAGEHAQ
jgi:DNA (cytosine-5)-methyltransferase 1